MSKKNNTPVTKFNTQHMQPVSPEILHQLVNNQSKELELRAQ